MALDFLVGYKHFFIKYVGLRYYANVDFLIANFKRTKGDIGINNANVVWYFLAINQGK